MCNPIIQKQHLLTFGIVPVSHQKLKHISIILPVYSALCGTENKRLRNPGLIYC